MCPGSGHKALRALPELHGAKEGSVRVFFDHCTSPVFASTLDGYLRNTEHSAQHIKDLPCGPAAADDVWMNMLSMSGDVWVVMTGDGRIQRSKVLREAYRRAGLRGFVLAPAYQKTPVHQTAANLVWRWPEIEVFIGSLRGAALFELPAGRSTKFSALQL
ncbi:MAG: hypothetical protein ACRYFY_15700 [Janthinobacterium lividum]